MKKPAKKKRDVERTISCKDFVAKLRRLADALEASKPIAIQVAGEKIRIPRDAVVSIEHEREGREEELELQFKWQRK